MKKSKFLGAWGLITLMGCVSVLGCAESSSGGDSADCAADEQRCENAEHFLEHQAANVKRGLKALGREDEAFNFLNEFYDHVDKPTGADLVSANDLVNRGAKIIRMAGFNKIKPMLSDEELDLL